MNFSIKTSCGITILGVSFLLAIILINWSSNQISFVTQLINPRTQLAAVSDFNSNLVVYYTFDDSINDSVGSNNGNVNGGAGYTDGKIGKAISLDGNDDYINISSNPISNYASANSVCAWVKPSDLSSSGGTYRTILNFSAETNNYTRIAVQNNGNLTVAYTAGGASYGQAAIGSPITTNSWSHICSVFNGSSLSIYINSESEADLADSASNGAVNYIGARGGGIGFWSGLIDDIRVYNRALQASEIQEIYNFSGNDESELPSPPPPNPGVGVGDIPPPPPQPSPPTEPTPPTPDSPIKTAASCSNSDIQNLIDLAADGDTILVPSGNCVWSPKETGLPAVSFNEKSINLKGAGIDKTVITFIGGTSYAWPHSREGGISVSGSSMKSFSISGFTFRSDASSVTELIGIYGPWRNWRVHNNKFNLIGSRALIINGLSDNTYGLIDHNIFAPPNPGQQMVIKNSASGGAGPAGTKDWLLPSSLGTEQAVYLEDNVFDFPVSPTSYVGAVLDCDYGGRFVARYNRITNTHITNHGGLEYANDDYARGCRQFEIYNNTFESQGGRINDQNAIDLRGGNGVIFNNTVMGEYGKWGSGVTLGFYCYSAKTNLCNGARADDENLSGQSGRHCRDCAGVGQDLGAYPSKQMTDPVYLWNNTHNGLPATVGTDAPNHILIGTDIINNTPRPGYTPYTYPHPLQNKEEIIIPLPNQPPPSSVPTPPPIILPPTMPPSDPTPSSIPILPPTSGGGGGGGGSSSAGTLIPTFPQIPTEVNAATPSTPPTICTPRLSPSQIIAILNLLRAFQADQVIIDKVSANLTCPQTTKTTYQFTRTLTLGSRGEDVRQLQIFLNKTGFTVSTIGAGSKGQETTYFGQATKQALIKFQEYYKSKILTSPEFTKGTGYFGPATMKWVNGRE